MDYSDFSFFRFFFLVWSLATTRVVIFALKSACIIQTIDVYKSGHICVEKCMYYTNYRCHLGEQSTIAAVYVNHGHMTVWCLQHCDRKTNRSKSLFFGVMVAA